MSESPPTRPPIDEHDESSTWWPDVSLCGVAVIWGINIPVMKIGLEQVDVYVFNAIRLTISVSVLAVFAWRERRRNASARLGVSFRSVLLYSAMVSVTYQLLFLLGIARTTAGNTALIIATVPIWTALLARLFLGEACGAAGMLPTADQIRGFFRSQGAPARV